VTLRVSLWLIGFYNFPIKTSLLARVTGRPRRVDKDQKRICITIHADFYNPLNVSRRSAFMPKLIAAA
jgi:hypothetical protein